MPLEPARIVADDVTTGGAQDSSDCVARQPSQMFASDRDDGIEARVRSVRSWADTIQPMWQGVFYVPAELQADIEDVRKNWYNRWVRAWDNVAIAHTASIEMKEVHFDAKSNIVTNKAAICPWVAV